MSSRSVATQSTVLPLVTDDAHEVKSPEARTVAGSLVLERYNHKFSGVQLCVSRFSGMLRFSSGLSTREGT